MKFLVIGGSGTLGSQFVRELFDRKAAVQVLARTLLLCFFFPSWPSARKWSK
ncbi:MAG: hypothetical protein ACREOI_16675 [bacterium]